MVTTVKSGSPRISNVFIAAAACSLIAALSLPAAASAMPITNTTNVDFAGGTTSFGYDGATFTLSDNGAGPFDPSPVSVQTNPSGSVTSLFGQPTVFFDPLRGPVTFDSTYVYSSFPTPSVIPFSATPSFLGLEVTGMDGTHYGYAEFSGTDLIAYAFESVAGVGIVPISHLAVPEPLGLPLLVAGLVGLGVARRTSR